MEHYKFDNMDIFQGLCCLGIWDKHLKTKVTQGISYSEYIICILSSIIFYTWRAMLRGWSKICNHAVEAMVCKISRIKAFDNFISAM